MSTRRVGRHSIELSNVDRVVIPSTASGGRGRRSSDGGITKGQMIDYYEAVAQTMLPHVRDRAMVMQRFPKGIGGAAGGGAAGDHGFYQKQVSPHYPDWMRNVTVATSKGPQQQVVCANAATLVYLANQGVMTFHPWLSRIDELDHPDLLIVDVDPPDESFEAARWTALLVRHLFETVGATAFARTTGSRGIHVAVPLDRTVAFAEVRALAARMMSRLAARHPNELTTEHRIAKRGHRVYLDVGRNAYGQTAVASYSIRARPGAPVATPIDWAELKRAGMTARHFDIKSVLVRVKRREDPWSTMRRHAVSADRLAERFEAAVEAASDSSSTASTRSRSRK